MRFYRSPLRPRTIWSETGGVRGTGFKVKLGNFKLTYSEENHTLTIPVELLQGNGSDYNIGTALIRRWDNSRDDFGSDQVWVIKNNIFAALDHMGIRYSNLL